MKSTLIETFSEQFGNAINYCRNFMKSHSIWNLVQGTDWVQKSPDVRSTLHGRILIRDTCKLMNMARVAGYHQWVPLHKDFVLGFNSSMSVKVE